MFSVVRNSVTVIFKHIFQNLKKKLKQARSFEQGKKKKKSTLFFQSLNVAEVHDHHSFLHYDSLVFLCAV